MRKKIKVAILMLSVVLFSMQQVVEAKYVFSYENTIAQMNIDRKAPIIEGVEENENYNQDVSITYYDNTKIKNAVYYYNSEVAEFKDHAKDFESGHIFKEEGYYKIIVIDIYGNEAKIEKFLIDKTPPEIKEIENGVIYDLPPEIEYYDKYGIEKVEITTEEELTLKYQHKNSNNYPHSDRTNHSITVHISYSPKNTIEYRWYIKKETELTYQLIDTNLENEFTFNNLQAETRYNIYCMSYTKDHKAYMSNLITAQTLGKCQVEISQVWDTGYQIEVTEIPEEYKKIYFPTWTEKNGQDDIVWYQREVINGKCTFTLDYSNHHYEQGKYNTHIYFENMSYVQSTYVYIGEEEPQEEKADFVGKVEITVTDKANNQTTTEFYVDTTVSITLEKISYERIKESLSNQIDGYDDSNHMIQIKKSKLDKITRLELNDCIYHKEGLAYLLGRGISSFKKLEYLDISGSTQFSTSDISTLSNLKYLDISNCQSEYVYDLSFLNQLPNLEYLDTTGTNIINEQYIENLTNLKEWKN